jgi:exosome complex component RRP43
MIRGVFKRGGEVEATEDMLMKCIAAAKHNYSATKQVIEESMADDDDE